MDLQEQLVRFKSLLAGGKQKKDSALFAAVTKFLRSYPGALSEAEKQEVLSLVRTAFELTEPELLLALSGGPGGLTTSISRLIDPATVEKEGRDFAPGGVLLRYIEYTDNSEPPLPYHLFAAFSILATTIGRRVWFDMGYFKIWPNMGVIIVGPSGVKKTTAGDIAVSIMREVGYTKIYAEKVTPEYLIEEMKDYAQGLIYAPEMVVFLGRQKYMDGAVPLIARLLDCPDEWSTGTISRRERVLREVACSTLFCSVPDWLITGASEDIFTGGFMARHILVVQYDSARCEPIPRPADAKLRKQVMEDLHVVRDFQGAMTFTAEAERLYDSWYRALQNTSKMEEHDITRTYLRRKHVHVIKIAMLYHLALCASLEICEHCFLLAAKLLLWMEQFVPPLMQNLFKSKDGEEALFILRLIATNGGMIDHSDLVRKAEYRMRAARVKDILASLKEGGRVEERVTSFFHLYILKEHYGTLNS